MYVVELGISNTAFVLAKEMNGCMQSDKGKRAQRAQQQVQGRN